jgi:hypothetical protein
MQILVLSRCLDETIEELSLARLNLVDGVISGIWHARGYFFAAAGPRYPLSMTSYCYQSRAIPGAHQPIGF